MQPKVYIISLFLVPFLCFGQHNNFQENKKRTEQILQILSLEDQHQSAENEFKPLAKNIAVASTLGGASGAGLCSLLSYKIIKLCTEDPDKTKGLGVAAMMAGLVFTIGGIYISAASGCLYSVLTNKRTIDETLLKIRSLKEQIGSLEELKDKTLSENLDNIKKTGTCAGCYLANAHLSSAIAEYNKKNPTNTGIDLSGAYCPNADFSGANLNNANLSHAQLQNANFEKSDLTGANLSHAHIDKANFKKTHLLIKYDELDIDTARFDAHGLAELLEHASSKSKA